MSWQKTVVNQLLQRWMKPRARQQLVDPQAVRRRIERLPTLRRPPQGFVLRTDRHGTDWIEPCRGTVARTVLYLHGGAYAVCSPRTHRSVTFQLARDAAARVVAIDYRLAPEHPFPAALEDALAAYRQLVASGTPAHSIVLGGDSAGGGLSLATLLALRDARDPLPAGAVLFSPWTDLTGSGASMRDNATSDVMFSAPDVLAAARLYLAQAPADTPLASPLLGALHGLPPLFIQASDSEILRDDATRLAERVRAAGGRAELALWPEMPHAWHCLGRVLPEAREALRLAAGFIRRVAP